MRYALGLLLAFAAARAWSADIVLTVNPPEGVSALLVEYGQCQDDLLAGAPVGIREVWGAQSFPPDTRQIVIAGVKPVRTCVAVRYQLPTGEVSLPEIVVVGP